MITEKTRSRFPGGIIREAHPFFMFEHIHEVPACLDACMTSDQLGLISAFFKDSTIKNIFTVGCGTSYNACQAVAYTFRTLTNLPAYAFDAMEFEVETPSELGKDSLIIAISHSGQTLPTCLALEKAASFNARTVSITAEPTSRLAKSANLSIIDPNGQETAFGKTRSYLSSSFQGMLIAAMLAPQEQRELFLANAKKMTIALRANMQYWETRAEEVAALWVPTVTRYFMSGFGVQAANAFEIALKIIEVTGESATGFTLEELSHGPGASFRKELGILLFQSEAKVLPRALEIANAVEISEANLIVITDSPEATWPKHAHVIAIPNLDAAEAQLSLFLNAIPAQLLLYFLALKKGYHPDINCHDQHPELADVSALFFPPGTH